jgi:GDP-mannose 6-dehydrogenase
MSLSVSVFGLGYVGCVSAACFAKEGHKVVGVDVSKAKVAMINSGTSTILEVGIGELVAEMVAAKRLRATSDVGDAVRDSTVSLICVGTPSRANGSLDLQYIERVCTEIGAALKEVDRWHTVVIRSTVLPGTVDGTVIPALERSSGKKFGVDFGVCSNPEFLRGLVDQGFLRAAVHADRRARHPQRRRGSRAVRGDRRSGAHRGDGRRRDGQVRV